MRFRRRGISWVKALLGCGCVVAVVAALVIGVGGYFAIRAARETFMMDPVRIHQLASEESPTAHLPEGFTPKFGINMTRLQMAMFADSSERLLALMTMPIKSEEKVSHEQFVQQMESSLSNNQKEKQGRKKLIQHNEFPITCEGQKLTGLRRLVEENGQRKWEYFVIGLSPQKKLTGLCVIGISPERDKSDKFFRDYAQTVKIQTLTK